MDVYTINVTPATADAPHLTTQDVAEARRHAKRAIRRGATRANVTKNMEAFELYFFANDHIMRAKPC